MYRDAMTELQSAVRRIKIAAKTTGLVGLSKEAGVPYTTVHAYAKRNWSNKNLDVIEALVAAADRIAARDAGIEP